MQFQKFDDAYLDSLCKGDRRTEEHFVQYFSELIHLKLRSRLNSRDAIEDVRQETFARIFVLLRGKEGVRNASALGALVNSICNHVLLEYYRSHSKSEGMEDASEIDIQSQDTDVLDTMVSKDTQKTVRQILEKLSDRDRQLLKRIFLEERDKDEVCAEFGVDREYLRVLLHRAKLSFKSFYVKHMASSGSSGSGRGNFSRYVWLFSALFC
ncbi:sigma-70 family RNA polymerase sigma factor [Alloacidobacterium sp.]|uniref:RNA polymerase sigma factor n=1 Tax=Alloacidobacterium sp. TaxID=2951999 RepID=UPI002D78A5C5|nr:sigma-70 family RNA polymerase sigma factor [Alloacidobacterium sp.]